MSEKQVAEKPKQNAVNISTMVRLRPLLESEKEQRQSIKCIDDKTLQMKLSGGKRAQRVEKVFNPNCTQRQVFDSIKPFISKCEGGYNVTVFTYGQTGSGKTYTMFGSDWNNIIRTHTNEKSKQSTFLRSLEQDQNHAGLIPRTINHVFNEVIVKRRKYIKVYCSFIQLYNENMMDLLQDDKAQMDKKLQIHQNKNDGIYVEGLSEIEVSDVDQCLQLMQRGEKNRIVRQTNMNVKSSRSHTLFQLLIQQVFPSNKSYRRMKVNLCDLAGSEKINKLQKMQQDHFEQLKNINLSLTTLGKVISCLSQKNQKAPFRESKLTRLLQDSLGGNTHTAIIATITSKSTCLQQSLNTLNFLQRAKQIKTLVLNKVYNDNPDMRHLEKQIAYLKDILKMKKTGVQVDVDLADKMKRLQHENSKLKEMVNQDLVQKLMKENTHLKYELQRKNNDQILDNKSKTKYATLDNNDAKSYDAYLAKEKSAYNQKSSDIASSYSATKGLIKQKQKRFMSTKTYTNNGDNRSTNKTNSKIFPSIRTIGSKNTPSTILERIHEIQRTKQANKLRLQHQLSMIGQTQNYQKHPNFAAISKYSNNRYGKY